jgi:hypothetical protein
MCGITVDVACDVGVDIRDSVERGALAPALGSRGVSDASAARTLVPTGGLAPGRLPRSQWLHKTTWMRHPTHRNKRAGRSNCTTRLSR